MQTKKTLLAAAVAAFFATLGASPIDPASAQSNINDPLDWRLPDTNDSPDAIRATMETHGLSEADAKLMLKRYHVAAKWLGYRLKAPEFAAAFAGSWLETEGMSAVIATTSPTLKQLAEADRPPNWIVVKVVPYSLESLRKASNAFYARVVDTLRARGAIPRGVKSTVDVRLNRVVVDVPADHPEVAMAARDAYAQLDDATRAMLTINDVAHGDESIAAACNDELHCGAPLRGGIAIDGSNGNGCTAGFVMSDFTNGQRYLLTAGHCGGPGTNWTQAGVTIGPVWISAYPDSNADFAAIQISRDDIWKSTNAVWKPHDNGLWPITSEAQAGTFVGAPICHTGRTTNAFSLAIGQGNAERCGSVSAAFVTVTDTDNNATVWDQGQFVNMPVCQGDSGGAIEYDHRAFGLVHGIYNNGSYWITFSYNGQPIQALCNSTGTFTWVQNVEGRTNLRLVTS
jgi:hypothetical protein